MQVTFFIRETEANSYATLEFYLVAEKFSCYDKSLFLKG